jgi:hypothetical protein
MIQFEEQFDVVWDACTKPSDADVLVLKNGVWELIKAPRYVLPPILKINQHVKAKHD